MLVAEMNRSFLQKVKSLDRTDIRDTQSYDILKLLNQAQDILIDRLISEQRYGDIRPIIDEATVASGAFIATGVYDPGINGAIVVDLSVQPSYRNFLRSQSKVTRTAVPAATDKFVQNKTVDPFTVFRFETNGTNKPVFTNPKQWQEGDYLIVLPDAYTSISNVYIHYVKTPTELVLTTPATDTSDLPAYLHDQIVDIAVQISGQVAPVTQ